MNWYENEVKIPITMIIPIKVIENGRPQKVREDYFGVGLKKINYLFLIGLLIASQIPLLSAFEAHIINVTAHICGFSETRTIGYWKNHPEVYENCLPQYLGDEEITTAEEVDEVFENANSDDMRDMLKGQLLAMKFNIGCFGIDSSEGEEFNGQTLEEIVDEADGLLRQNPEPPREVLEEMKNLLDEINNLHQIRYCSENSNFEPVVEPSASDNFMAAGWIGTGLTPEETNFVELTPEEKLIQLSPEEGGPAPPLVEEDTEPASEPTEPVFEEPIVIEATTTEEAIIATTTEESIIEVPITSTTTEEIAIEATTTEEALIEEPAEPAPVEEPVIESTTTSTTTEEAIIATTTEEAIIEESEI